MGNQEISKLRAGLRPSNPDPKPAQLERESTPTTDREHARREAAQAKGSSHDTSPQSGHSPGKERKFISVDNRKGAERLMAMSKEKREGGDPAPLDPFRERRLEKSMVPEALVQTEKLPQRDQASVREAFTEPAVVRAWQVNPEKVVEILGRNPGNGKQPAVSREGSELLAKDMPFRVEGAHFNANHESALAKNLDAARSAPKNSEIRKDMAEVLRDLRAMHTEIRPRILGGSPGIETIAVKLIEEEQRHPGTPTHKRFEIEDKLRDLRDNRRAREDLETVEAIAQRLREKQSAPPAAAGATPGKAPAPSSGADLARTTAAHASPEIAARLDKIYGAFHTFPKKDDVAAIREGLTGLTPEQGKALLEASRDKLGNGLDKRLTSQLRGYEEKEMLARLAGNQTLGDAYRAVHEAEKGKAESPAASAAKPAPAKEAASTSAKPERVDAPSGASTPSPVTDSAAATAAQARMETFARLDKINAAFHTFPKKDDVVAIREALTGLTPEQGKALLEASRDKHGNGIDKRLTSQLRGYEEKEMLARLAGNQTLGDAYMFAHGTINSKPQLITAAMTNAGDFNKLADAFNGAEPNKRLEHLVDDSSGNFAGKSWSKIRDQARQLRGRTLKVGVGLNGLTADED